MRFFDKVHANRHVPRLVSCSSIIQVALVLLLAASAMGDSVTLYPLADTTIASDGSASSGTSDTILAGTTGGSSRQRALLRFELSGIPSNAVVSSATLALTVVKMPAVPNDSTFSIHRVTTPWNETEATWVSATTATEWLAPGGDFVSPASGSVFISGLGTYALTNAGLGLDVRRWIANSSENHGWIIVSESESLLRTARHFASRDNTNSAVIPRLTVDFTVPSGPQLTAMGRENQLFVFSFLAVRDTSYSVQFKTNVAQAEWHTLTNFSAIGTTAVTVRDEMAPQQRFYRVTATPSGESTE